LVQAKKAGTFWCGFLDAHNLLPCLSPPGLLIAKGSIVSLLVPLVLPWPCPSSLPLPLLLLLMVEAEDKRQEYGSSMVRQREDTNAVGRRSVGISFVCSSPEHYSFNSNWVKIRVIY
jgi:hypothetical protein